MRTTFLLAAICAAAYAQELTDGYDVTYTVDGGVEIEDTALDMDIAAVSSTYYESLARADGTTDENGEVYLADDEVITWIDGWEFQVTSAGGLEDGGELQWYTCSINDTGSLDCIMIRADLSTSSNPTTYATYNFQMPPSYFADETAELNLFADMFDQALATPAFSGTNDQDSKTTAQTTDQTLTTTWIETSEFDAASLTGNFTYTVTRELSDTYNAITDWTLADLTEFEPSSPCYDLQGADETDFEEYQGVNYVSADGATTLTAWANVGEDTFEELKDVCSGATSITTFGAAVLAMVAALGF